MDIAAIAASEIEKRVLAGAKKPIIAKFEQLNENSSVCMIFVIKALEISVNLSNIQHVVLYEMSKKKKFVII